MSVGAPPVGPVKFSWDCDVPQTPFWSDLDFKTGRNFLNCYSNSELDAMPFPKTMPKAEKLELLLDRLTTTLKEKTAALSPKLLWESDMKAWSNLLLGLYTMNDELDRLDECDRILDEMTEHGTFNLKMSAKKMRGIVRERQKNYSEAERLARECVVWLDELPPLGPDSPQALSNLRSIIRPVWKQGRREEAKELAKEHERKVEAMSDQPQSTFVQYQEDERGYLRDLMLELEAWDLDNRK
ncbi:hypothetical protein HKX48_002731 [Thoreauomyces humboldtii]|nr:hypothetical protein HKX48_002731 [Thoreauomyces humboldtii]